MIEKSKCFNKNQKYAPLLIDLSITSDCLCYNLIIARLHANGFDNALKLVYSYLHKGKIS